MKSSLASRERHSIPPPEGLRYDLQGPLPLRWHWLYAAQWLSYALGIILITVVLIGPGMGLGQAETIAFGSRVLIVTGLATILQIYFGHGYPIVEAPAVIFWALYLFTFEHAASRQEALSDITGGMIVAGLAIILFAGTGLARRSARVFTPALAGTVLILIGLSFLPASGRHLFGVTPDRPAGDPSHLLGVLLVVLAGALMSLTGRRLVRTVPIFLTAAGAYVAYLALGRIDLTPVSGAALLALPTALPWGEPAFRPHVALTYALTGILGTLNTLAAIQGVSGLYDHGEVRGRRHRGILVNGVGQLLAAIGGASGTSSHSTSAVIVRISQVGTRSVLALAGLILLVLGFIPIFSAFLTTVPLAIADGIFYLIVAGLISVGLEQYRRLELNTRTRLVIGIPIVGALSVTYAPAALFEAVPYGGSLLIRNPIIVGAVLGVVCEQGLFAAWRPRLRAIRSRLRFSGAHRPAGGRWGQVAGETSERTGGQP